MSAGADCVCSHGLVLFADTFSPFLAVHYLSHTLKCGRVYSAGPDRCIFKACIDLTIEHTIPTFYDPTQEGR